MKKILSVFLVAGILTACDDTKKEETTTTTTTDSTTVTKTDEKMEEKKEATTTTAEVKLEVPKFTDADVQKFADEYAAFVTTAGKLKADNVDEYSKKNVEFTKRKGETELKLTKTPDEEKKFEEFMTKAEEVFDAQTGAE